MALLLAQKLSSVSDSAPFVLDLSGMTQPAQIVTAMVAALGVTVIAGHSAEKIVIEALQDTRQLELFDNFEQVREAAHIVAALVRACPMLSVIVTSRCPLRVANEQEFAVSLLPVPETKKMDLPSLLAIPSITLFVTRAQAIDPDFALSSGNAAVVHICRSLNGLPLALELAAAQLRLFSPQKIAGRLDSPLQLLQQGRIDSALRHRDLDRSLSSSSMCRQNEFSNGFFRRRQVFKTYLYKE